MKRVQCIQRVIEIMIYDKADEVIKELLNHFLIDIKLGWKHE